MMARLRSARPEVLVPAVVLLASVVFLLVSPVFAERSLSSFDVFNLMQGFAPLGLVTLAVGLTVLCGEYDLSVVSMFAAGGMMSVLWGEDHPVLAALAAVAVCLLIGAVQGAIIAFTGLHSIPVTLGSGIAIIGFVRVIGHDGSQSYDNFDVPLWLDRTLATVLSPRSLVTLAIIVIVALLFARTSVGSTLRAVGGNRRASVVVGVRVDRTLITVFGVSGALASLAGSLNAYSFASATADQSNSLLIYATAGTLLGGVSLAGGRGHILGLAAGGLAVATLQQSFLVLATPDYVSNIVFALLLVAVAALDAPGLRQMLSRRLARRRVPSRGAPGGQVAGSDPADSARVGASSS